MPVPISVCLHKRWHQYIRYWPTNIAKSNGIFLKKNDNSKTNNWDIMVYFIAIFILLFYSFNKKRKSCTCIGPAVLKVLLSGCLFLSSTPKGSAAYAKRSIRCRFIKIWSICPGCLEKHDLPGRKHISVNTKKCLLFEKVIIEK